MATARVPQRNNIGWEYLAGSRNCSRCQGLMVMEQSFGSLFGTSPTEVPLRRCVQCGEVIDPVILQNRRLQVGGDLGRTSDKRQQ
ncbi:MAG: hypothetical protein Nkreftii_003298 [Candidatus Nitrospira kreftii]|uniref:Uncharacterized protein n=1 Tax=Candidatus Nitrospira kreftii TaxID=2652173 RepID=A0A7S8FGD4_9BACT|nr:MAG: hypothetical protein Nkreftii_003298 [Candidatus Nitrospira kreftii]